MTEYMIVNGNLVEEHEHNFKVVKYKGHVDIPMGTISLPVRCQICGLEGRSKGFFDGRSFTQDSLEIIIENNLEELELENV
jgi:hypothetical protein